MRIVIKGSDAKVAEYVAELVVSRINEFQPTKERPFVLGLPTGSSPLKTYQLIIRAFRERRVSFKNVVTFNMDEYVGLPETHPESYHSQMFSNFFNFIDIPKENIHILDGNASDLIEECIRYEEKISSFGGIRLFLCGLGHDGHIAFNEPGSSLSSKTRVKSLNAETIQANARFFNDDISKVPTMALTVGVSTVLSSREVMLIATGTSKALAVAHCVEGSISMMYPASVLQLHPKVCFCLDTSATSELRVKTVQYFKGLQKYEDELQRRQENAKKMRGAKGMPAASKL